MAGGNSIRMPAGNKITANPNTVSIAMDLYRAVLARSPSSVARRDVCQRFAAAMASGIRNSTLFPTATKPYAVPVKAVMLPIRYQP